MLNKLLKKIIGDPNEKEIKKLWPLVKKINQIEEEYQKTLTDEDIPKKTAEFKKRLADGEKLDNLLPEAFALVKNACRRQVGKKWDVRGHETEWFMIPYDVQLIGGIILHQGKISEMKTGEGKTLVCTMPIYLNALTEKGVFLVTVNDYLAQRDAEWMSGIYKFLGLSIGTILHGQTHEEKKAAYSCDITYGTNNEFGFDYLRDNMSTNLENRVQKTLYYAIVDEVDSILIDEARTPLIISAPAEESTSKYRKYNQLIKQLEENKDYNLDEKIKTAVLTEAGIAKLEKILGVDNIYAEGGFQEIHHVEQALRAQAAYQRDTDYVVKDNEVIIVDEFTGRLMPGRRYSDGLHQAIEAKENVEVKRESRTLATVSFQNYFRLFDKLAGMTGTAATEAEEFYKIYKLDTIIIPTNKLCVRQDHQDSIYKNEKGKFKAVVNKVKELHEKGQPVLIGTISIEKSEVLHQLLKMSGIPHHVLNAKHHEKEAEIVANAGQKGAVTIATNMAGRGTDIKLGSEVKDLGGLFILGTERHESRRIDNQLRGRSGRQGDSGASQFFVSMEDQLMRLFGSERAQKMMDAFKIPDDMPIENALISRSIESAQKKVEGHNFDIRKHLVEYDDVMNKQREIIYSRRRKVLESDNIKNDILLLMEKETEAIVLNHTANRKLEEWNYKEIFETINAIHRDPITPLNQTEVEAITDQEKLITKFKNFLWNEYEEREKSLPDPEILRQIERGVYLRVIDTLWMEHIDSMTSLRENVALQGYGQRDPLIIYKQEAYEMISKLLTSIQSNTVNTLFKVDIAQEVAQRMFFQAAPKTMQTNENDIEGALSSASGRQDGAGPNGSAVNPVVVKVKADSPTGETSAGAVPKVGRNEPCPCGSGKKYKKCCGR